MENRIAAIDNSGKSVGIGNIPENQFCIPGYILWLARRQIIKNAYAVTSRQQSLNEVGADKASPAGHQANAHASIPALNKPRVTSARERVSGVWLWAHH